MIMMNEAPLIFHASGFGFWFQHLRQRLDRFVAGAMILAMIAVGVMSLKEATLFPFVVFYGFLTLGICFSIMLGRGELRLFLFIFSINVLFVLFLYGIYLGRYGVPYFQGGSDDVLFENAARQFVDNFAWYDYRSAMGWYTARLFTGYAYILSLFYRVGRVVGGYHTLAPRFFNSFLLALLVVMVSRAARRDFTLTSWLAVGAGLWLGLAPIAMFVSAHVFRDVLVVGLMFLLLYWWNGLPRYDFRMKLAVLLLTPPLFFLLWEIRERSAQMMVLVLVFTLFSTYWENKAIRYMSLVSVMVLGIIGFMRLPSLSTLLQVYAQQYERYAAYRSALGAGGLSGPVFAAPFAISAPLRVVYLMISPLPIISMEVERTWLSVGTLWQIALLPFAGWGGWVGLHQRRMWSYLAAFGIYFLSTALVTFTLRHILMYYPYLVLFTALGVQQYLKSRHALRWTYLALYFLGISAVTVYAILKTQPWLY